MDTYIVVGLGVAGFIVNILVLSIGGTRALGRSELAIQESIARNRKETDDKINAEVSSLRREWRQEHEQFMQQWGEGLAAARQKMTDMEIWNRDNFVRHRDFTSIVQGLTSAIDGISKKMDAFMERIDGKLERWQLK